MNAREILAVMAKENVTVRDLTLDELRMYAPIIESALSLLAAAEANDSGTTETDALWESLDDGLTEYGLLVRMKDHARKMERQRTGLAAEVARLRDARRIVALVLDKVRDYLPPDGISKDDFINAVIEAVDPMDAELLAAIDSARAAK